MERFKTITFAQLFCPPNAEMICLYPPPSILLFADECQESQGLRDHKTGEQIKQFVLSMDPDRPFCRPRGNFVVRTKD